MPGLELPGLELLCQKEWDNRRMIAGHSRFLATNQERWRVKTLENVRQLDVVGRCFHCTATALRQYGLRTENKLG